MYIGICYSTEWLESIYFYHYFINIRSDRKTYLVPLVTGEPSCTMQS